MSSLQRITTWLLSRGLSQEVIDASGVHWNGSKIVIPVKDIDGNVIFNKYRRDPESEDGPKYFYETGSSAALFNVHTVKDLHNQKIFITESELDSLLLNSLGLNAVSSTGGSQTFHPEWFLDFLGNEIYICYDADDAGVRGALRVNTMLTSAKIIFLPYEKGIKDVTDYFKQFVNSSGSYTRYLHFKTDNNIYLLHAKLVITYTYIVPPAVAGAYRAKAELTSAVFDTGVADGVAYNSVMWKGTLNSGKVRFQIATSDTETVTDFVGPNCTNGTWYDIDTNAPTEIKCFSVHNNKRYFKYKIQLCSASGCDVSGNGNPEVTDVIISWSP